MTNPPIRSALFKEDIGRQDRNLSREWIEYFQSLMRGVTFAAETPAGKLNGVNLTFTISAQTPIEGSFFLILNGVVQEPDVDYTLSGRTITYTVAPAALDKHTARFAYYA